SAASWRVAGYAWLSEQALELARILDPEYSERALLSEPGASFEQDASRRKLWLWDLISPVPRWQKTLEALERAAATISARPHVHAARAAFVIDMADGRLVRPLLQEF